MSDKLDRRTFVKTTSAGLAVMASAASATGAEPPQSVVERFKVIAKEKVPQADLCGMKIGRILLGGNLLTHFTHSRDLQYVYTLAKQYNTKEKIFRTMAVAEAHGINAVVIHTADGVTDWLREYREVHGGKMRWIICPTAGISDNMDNYRSQCKMLAGIGTDSIYLWGVHGDRLAGFDLNGNKGKMRADLIRRAIETAKEFGVPAGLGAHRYETILCCEENEIPCDYYVKTFHHHEYPTARINHDSMWAHKPEKTAELMAKVEKPWVAFKVMAAGAIPPADALQYAFENGADFSLMGMFDYEIPEDAAIANRVLALPSVKERKRRWIT